MLLPLLAFVVGWMIFKVPAIGDQGIVQTATYTFAGGEPIAVVRPKDSNDNNINRNIVTIDKVPAHVRQAVLAAEDRTFYSNPGFDPVGIARAVYHQVTGGVGGGSTITQQYVKVSTGQDQASLWRKYKEIILSIKISKEQTKDQILENYLNTVYFGRGAYGIQAAAQAYFGKDVGQLSITQGAMLAGMIQSPSALDPMKNPRAPRSAGTYTLDQMEAAGFIPPAERGAQKFPAEVRAAAPVGAGVPADDRYHIFERAEAELRANGISQDEIDTGGLTVTTTIDANRQKAAVDAVAKVMKTSPPTCARRSSRSTRAPAPSRPTSAAPTAPASTTRATRSPGRRDRRSSRSSWPRRCRTQAVRAGHPVPGHVADGLSRARRWPTPTATAATSAP